MSSRIGPTQRAHIAEQVFEQLAAAILRGEFAAGAQLPPERVLGERCGASRVVVRQAIHRLADMGLVRVRQGSPTMVCELAEADLRVVPLLYRFASEVPLAQPYLHDMIERDYLQGLLLIEVVMRRGSEDDRRDIAHMVESTACDGSDRAQVVAFEQQFWRRVARAGGNRILQMEFDWWQHVRDGGPAPEAQAVSVPGAMLMAFYRELGRRIASGEDPLGFYLQGIYPILKQLV